MTGPEHYREAERLAAEAYHEDRYEKPEVLLARAQVHATLALAAATALNPDLFAPDWHAWNDIAGVKPDSAGAS